MEPGSSASGSSDEKPAVWSTERIDLVGLGKLMYHLVTSSTSHHPETRRGIEEKLKEDLKNPKSQIAMDVMDVVFILINQNLREMTLEDALQHPFFSRQ
ncbi:hypothetical protein BASA61_010358 [Batrachochytrium salamandrivorans]|nr:hypothetical protein BASA61_010358 [Batrachochytrium salamandrivorans]